MILKWGSFSFTQDKVWVEWQAQNVISKRGYRMWTIVRAVFGGTVVGSSLSALDTAIAGVETALGSNAHDLILYRNDGTTATRHQLITANTMDGTKVMHFKWLKGSAPGVGNGREYDNKRSFIAVIQGELAANETEIVDWHEDTIQHGTGFGDFAVKEAIVGTPQLQVTQAATKCALIQQGYAIGWSAYPSFPAAVDPTFFRSRVATLYKSTPTLGRNTNRLYPIRWRYEHEMPTDPSIPDPTLP